MKYWVYQNGQVPGAYEPAELAAMPGFSQTSLVCPTDNAANRQWQKAGHYPDLVAAIDKYQVAPPPPPRLADELLSESSHKLFRHVTDLMQELENRREEKALTKTLQRQLGEVKDELLRTRERAQALELEIGSARGSADREANVNQQLESLRSQLKERQTEMTALNDQLHGQRQELTRLRAQTEELLEANKLLTQSRDDLSREVAEKDATLARAMGLIQRMETELDELTGRTVPRVDPWDRPPVESIMPPHNPPAPPSPKIVAAALTPPAPPAPKATQAPAIKTKKVQTPVEQSPARIPEPVAARALPQTAAVAASEPAQNYADTALPRPTHPIHTPPPGSFTSDDGSVEKPVPIPPEGELAPITPPWKLAMRKLAGIIKKK